MLKGWIVTGSTVSDWDALTARLDPEVWKGLDVEGQTFAIIEDSRGVRWAAPYSVIEDDRPQFGMSEEMVAEYAEEEGHWIDSFASEVEAGEWGPPEGPACDRGPNNDEPTTCDDSVGPRTYEEAERRGLLGQPFEFVSADFEDLDEDDGD